MIITKKTHDHTNCHNSDTITIVDEKNHTGRTPWKPSLKDLEIFIKEEIGAAKSCGCCSCNYRRLMFRKMQEVMKENILLKSENESLKKKVRV
jgi:hypothetical protein